MKLTKFGIVQTLFATSSCVLAICLTAPALAATSTDSGGGQVGSSIDKPLGDRFAMFERVPAQQTRVIFYRPKMQNLPGAATVYVNGYYHASLIPGGYAEICLPPNKAELGVRIVEAGRSPKDSLDTITAITLNGGQTTFMRVREQASSRAVLQPVAAAEALPDVQSTRQQIHTISRVPEASECVDGGPAPVVAKPQQINLAADALFAYGKSDRNSMSLAGRQSLDNLIGKIKGDYINVDRINVIGHADPLGNDTINERLSSERAVTVRDYLQINGLQGTRLTGEGRGAREPVVANCSRVVSPTSVLCNQPNRRVVVEITGARRQ